MKPKNRTLLSLVLGILGIVSLFIEFSGFFAYSDVPFFSSVGEIANKIICKIDNLSPFFTQILIGYFTFASIPFFFISIFGIFLATKSYSSLERKNIVVLAIILNTINLLFSLFLNWALWGLARGM